LAEHDFCQANERSAPPQRNSCAEYLIKLGHRDIGIARTPGMPGVRAALHRHRFTRAGGGVVVPEPGSAVLMGLASSLLIRRRRGR
jgi:hypothetical protein